MANDIQEDVIIDDPELVLRWRLSHRKLVAQSRHLATLKARGLGQGLVSWCYQHIEWTLPEGTLKDPHGVLVIKIDTAGRAQMEVVPYSSLMPATASELIVYAEEHGESMTSGIDSDVAWVVRPAAADKTAAPQTRLVALTSGLNELSGVNSLIRDLGRAQGFTVVCDENELAQHPLTEADEVFLVSDEHGVVPSTDHGREVSQKFKHYWDRLVASLADK